MFGDKLLIGHYDISVDGKGRSFLPPSTGREKDDILALMYDSDIESYRLYNLTMLEPVFEEYHKLILEAKNKEDEIFYKKRLLDFAKNIIQQYNVDANGRINFRGAFECNSKLEVIGAGNHLILKNKRK